MESMEMKRLFGGIYNNKTVLITGHTGFKGSWLSLWLKCMGASVIGYSLEPPTVPNHFSLIKIDMNSIIGDIRDMFFLDQTIKKYKPDIVFHLAAQPIVRLSYIDPLETYDINVMGTLKVFEVCRKNNVKVIINITSDKCYDNKEWIWGYREIDSLGGYDPYSSSKACSELLTSSYRNSFLNIKDYGTKHNTLLASCRAGNVIGGGDWAQDRLMTDLVTSASKGEKLVLRNPKATRPWQHVLEPLSGYLLLGQKLLEGYKDFADAWNFGPQKDDDISVEDVVKYMKKIWNKIDYRVEENQNNPHEAKLLKLDCSKSRKMLYWRNVWDSEISFEKTINWYKEFYENNKILTLNDLRSYILDAKKKNIVWAV